MLLPEPQVMDLAGDSEIGLALQQAPASAAVFLLWPREGSPYLARTASLARRLSRLLRPRKEPSRLLNLRTVARSIEYWRTGSRLESFLYSWDLARRHFPETYLKVLKLKFPPYVKLILSNVFPRTQITRRLSGGKSCYFGPFRTRTAAERFESEFLDLFQIRRCEEDLDPSPDHPGCIYGEMNRCLRPCQQVVGIEEYASEVLRVEDFLASGGESLLKTAVAARDRSSAELDFEEAARQHQRVERIQQVQRLRDELARDVDRLDGVAIAPSAEPEAVELLFMLGGRWLTPRRLDLATREGQPVSLDQRLRSLVADLETPSSSPAERQEHLAILARWYYSTWRDGEWIPFDGPSAFPYRKLVNAVHRLATRDK